MDWLFDIFSMVIGDIGRLIFGPDTWWDLSGKLISCLFYGCIVIPICGILFAVLLGVVLE